MELDFVSLLRLAWTTATLPILMASLPIHRLGFSHRILLGLAGRGKTMPSSSRKFTVPQSYFLHFYIVAVVLTTSMLLATWLYAYGKLVPLGTEPLQYATVASQLTGVSRFSSIHKSPPTTMEHRYRVWRTVLLLLLMEAQVMRRLYESIYVFNYSPSARMHIIGYLTGLFFYTGAPLSLASSCASETLNFVGDQMIGFIVKGLAGMEVTEFNWLEYIKPLMNLGWCQWIGASIFIWGWLHQLSCHTILGSLREQRGADEYLIPHGDWFNYVSCPHYLAEVVIYFGILVASGGDFTTWLLFFFVVANLVFAAAETHRWYHHKFDKYPKSRHAIIPYIY